MKSILKEFLKTITVNRKTKHFLKFNLIFFAHGFSKFKLHFCLLKNISNLDHSQRKSNASVVRNNKQGIQTHTFEIYIRQALCIIINNASSEGRVRFR